MDVVTKSVEAQVRPVESDHPNGQAEVVLSTETLDRDGEHLWIDEWKQPLPARIHIDGDHGRSIDKTVGSCVPRIDGNKMVGVLDYAGTSYAQMVRQLVKEGHIQHLSVTYGETKSQKDGKPQRELFNAAFVAIPANPEAVVLSSKAAKLVETIKQFGASGNDPKVTHDGMVQAIHDAAYHLGASCTNETEADPGQDEGANKSADPHTSGTKSVGLQESAEESAAAEPAADKAAGPAAAETPADTAEKEALAVSARALEFLMNKNI